MESNEWQKKVYVTSSLSKKDNQYSLFIGRWQPLHDGHKELFSRILNEGGNVCIAIRDIEEDEKNPFSVNEVFMNICKEYKDLIDEGKVKVIIIPDICSVEFGRGVGYDIIEHIPPQKVADISATKIREKMKQEGRL